jgi:hypothetical protein
LKWRNLVHLDDGTIAIIDTESFTGVKRGLHSLLEKNDLDPDAKKLIKSEIQEIDNLINNIAW